MLARRNLAAAEPVERLLHPSVPLCARPPKGLVHGVLHGRRPQLGLCGSKGCLVDIYKVLGHSDKYFRPSPDLYQQGPEPSDCLTWAGQRIETLSDAPPAKGFL